MSDINKEIDILIASLDKESHKNNTNSKTLDKILESLLSKGNLKLSKDQVLNEIKMSNIDDNYEKTKIVLESSKNDIENYLQAIFTKKAGSKAISETPSTVVITKSKDFISFIKTFNNLSSSFEDKLNFTIYFPLQDETNDDLIKDFNNFYFKFINQFVSFHQDFIVDFLLEKKFPFISYVNNNYTLGKCMTAKRMIYCSLQRPQTQKQRIIINFFSIMLKSYRSCMKVKTDRMN